MFLNFDLLFIIYNAMLEMFPLIVTTLEAVDIKVSHCGQESNLHHKIRTTIKVNNASNAQD